MGISVVIPAYNEEANIASCLAKVYSVLKNLHQLEYEVIVVNDGSKDKTGEIAKKETKKYPNFHVVENQPNRGYGGALKRGFSEARKDFIVFVPGDNQFDFSEITFLLDKQVQTQADIVSGIRRHGGKDPFHRLMFRWAWNSVVRALFGYLASDVDCGFKLFRRSILEKIQLPSNGAMVDTQLFAGARARGITIAEIPVTHLPRTAGKSTGGNPKVVFKALRELLIFWWQLRKELLVERGKAVMRWEMISLCAILLAASFIRLYHIDRYMTFLGDEGRDALVMRDIILGRHFPLIGPGTSVGNMYLGPLYYYLTAPSLAIANFSPVGPSVQVAIIGVFTVALLWWVSRQWMNRIPAFIISALYAISPLIVVYSRSSWNPNVMPFFALLSIYGIWKVAKYGYWRWLFIVGIALALALNSHYLGLLLLCPLGIYWLYSYISQKSNRTTARPVSTMSIIVFLLLMSPLFFFDLKHNWQNFSALKTFFSNRQTTINLKAYKALPEIWPIFVKINTDLLGPGNVRVGESLALFVGLTSLLFLFSRRQMEHLLVLTWFVTGLVGLGLYKQHLYTHYYGFLFPAPFLLLGFSLQYLFQKRLTFIPGLLAVFLIVWVSIQNSPLNYAPNDQLAHTRQTTKTIISQSSGQPLNLALLAKSNYDASYRYYLSLQTSTFYTIHEKLADQLFVICEDNPCQPIGNPLWEIAAFGWAKVDKKTELPWNVSVYRLIHNPEGK